MSFTRIYLVCPVYAGNACGRGVYHFYNNTTEGACGEGAYQL